MVGITKKINFHKKREEKKTACWFVCHYPYPLSTLFVIKPLCNLCYGTKLKRIEKKERIYPDASDQSENFQILSEPEFDLRIFWSDLKSNLHRLVNWQCFFKQDNCQVEVVSYTSEQIVEHFRNLKMDNTKALSSTRAKLT